jgi:UDP-N-acetylglucosamine 2-epimerase
MILTDSGGMQKEAYFFGVPCLTLRPETEWVETVQAGWNVVVGTDTERIVAATQEMHPTGSPPAVFGDGRASERIINFITT